MECKKTGLKAPNNRSSTNKDHLTTIVAPNISWCKLMQQYAAVQQNIEEQSTDTEICKHHITFI